MDLAFVKGSVVWILLLSKVPCVDLALSRVPGGSCFVKGSVCGSCFCQGFRVWILLLSKVSCVDLALSRVLCVDLAFVKGSVCRDDCLGHEQSF